MTVQSPPAPSRAPRTASVQAALRQTPGRLRGALAVLVVLILGAGVTGVTALVGKSSVIEETTTQSGRLSVAALELFQALSHADATAASSYLTAGTASEQERSAYRESMRDATVALATAAGEVETAEDVELVARINAHLPVYTGLIETARTFNRLGEPVGATYQRQASTLMRSEMLPDASALQQNALGELETSRSAATAFPWTAAALAVLALATLVWAQLWLTRKTNRVFNLGLVGATVAVIGFAGWLALAALASASHTDRSHEEGAATLELLAEAHIAAQQARAEESLVLIARGEDSRAEERYAERMTALVGDDGLLPELSDAYRGDPALAGPLAEAEAAALTWSEGHHDAIELARDGDYAEAVELAVGAGDGGLATSFDVLDEQLSEATDVSAERFVDANRDAQRSLAGTVPGLTALCLLALVCAAVGIQMRVSEYHA